MQTNGTNCGVYAIAYAMALCLGASLAKLLFDEIVMRPHPSLSWYIASYTDTKTGPLRTAFGCQNLDLDHFLQAKITFGLPKVFLVGPVLAAKICPWTSFGSQKWSGDWFWPGPLFAWQQRMGNQFELLARSRPNLGSTLWNFEQVVWWSLKWFISLSVRNSS